MPLPARVTVADEDDMPVMLRSVLVSDRSSDEVEVVVDVEVYNPVMSLPICRNTSANASAVVLLPDCVWLVDVPVLEDVTSRVMSSVYSPLVLLPVLVVSESVVDAVVADVERVWLAVVCVVATDRSAVVVVV